MLVKMHGKMAGIFLELGWKPEETLSLLNLLPENGRFFCRSNAQLILKNLLQNLVLPCRLCRFTHLNERPHQLAVGGFKQVVVGNGLAVEVGGLGVTAVSLQQFPPPQ